jgi:hypothetical protein
MAPEMALLKACGFVQAAVPVSPGADPAVAFALSDPHFTGEGSGCVIPIDLYKNTDGNLWRANSCVGDVTFNFIANQIPTMDFKFRGSYVGVPSAVASASFYTGETPVACQGESLSIRNGSTWSSLVARSLVYELGNIIPDRPGLNASYGFDEYAIVGREPTATLVVELPYDITDFNPEDVFVDQEELTVSLSHNSGGSAGNLIDIEFDAFIDEQPVASEDNGMLIYTIKLKQAIEESPGSTPFTLTFS